MILDKLKPHIQKVYNIGFALLTVGGFALSILGLVSQNTLEWQILLSIIILNSILLLLIGALTCVFYYKYKTELDDINAERKTIVKKIQLVEKNTIDLIDYHRYIMASLNKFLARLYLLNDNYFEELNETKKYIELLYETEKQPEEEIDNIKTAMIHRTKEKYYLRIIDEYNRLLGNITTHLKTILEQLIKSNGHELEVSIAIKQFDRIYLEPNSYNDVVVYTAFRDLKTYNQNVREIGEKKYSIGSNSGFIHCLQNEMYIVNNFDKTGNSYSNENKDCLNYYNSAVVTPILCLYEGRKKYFGYLICDASNDDQSSEVFDTKIGNVMYATSLLLGTYYDNISYAWEVIIEDYDDILDFVYKYYYKFEV